jgi:hypothetical protein
VPFAFIKVKMKLMSGKGNRQLSTSGMLQHLSGLQFLYLSISPSCTPWHHVIMRRSPQNTRFPACAPKLRQQLHSKGFPSLEALLSNDFGTCGEGVHL